MSERIFYLNLEKENCGAEQPVEGPKKICNLSVSVLVLKIWLKPF